MNTSNYCSKCGALLSQDTQFCSHCGTKIEIQTNQVIISSTKSPLITLLLCLFLGSLGMHRFYVGKIGTGILMLLTLGCLGIWTMIDLIFIVCNAFTDSKGQTLILIKNPSTLAKFFMVIGAIIANFFIYIFTLFAILFYLTTGLVEVVQNQLDALRAGDIVKAYSYTSKDFQKVTSLEDFKNFVNQHPALTHYQKASFSKREIENNLGKIQGTLREPDNSHIAIEFRFVKENGEWKIIGIQMGSTEAGVKVAH